MQLFFCLNCLLLVRPGVFWYILIVFCRWVPFPRELGCFLYRIFDYLNICHQATSPTMSLHSIHAMIAFVPETSAAISSRQLWKHASTFAWWDLNLQNVAPEHSFGTRTDWHELTWYFSAINLNRWKLIRGGFKHLHFTFFTALFVLETSPINLTWQTHFVVPGELKTPLGERKKTPEGISTNNFRQKIGLFNPWVHLHLHLISDVLMNVQCLHQLELALHYVWAPWSPWSG